MKMMWVQLFPGNIDNCIFSDCPCGFLWPQIFNRILGFCSWHGLCYLLNFDNMSQIPDFCPNYSKPLLYPSDCK